jgi:hypothetical protein
MNFDPTCIGKLDQASILHFYGTYRFYQNLYPKLAARIASELCEAIPAVV